MKEQMLTPSAIIANWKRDKDYKTKMGFTSKWPELTRFVEGEQWGKKAMDKWKSFPFIVVNQCDFIKENKKSNILAQPLKMIFSPSEMPENPNEEEENDIMEKSEDYTDLTQNVWDDMVDQDQLNKDAVDDTLVLGSAFYHYYFDDSYSGSKLRKGKGKICGEIIDPTDIALANPQLKSHQINKQRYIILKSYEDTEQLKEASKKNGTSWQLITPDKDNDEEYDNGIIDIEQAERTVAYTMYYMENKEVWWTKVTATSTIQKPRRLSPSEQKFAHYPIEMLVFKPRKRSAFGISVIEDIIPAQKGINFLYSMIAYGVQQTAWPKVLAKAGALIGNSFTNEPGEIIIDHDIGNQGDSIKYMQPPNFSNMPPLLIDKLTDAIRQTTGANDVNAGEAIGANMAAAAINLLQSQARKPNEQSMNQLYAVNKRIGRIWEDFFKCYFILPTTIVSKDTDGKMKSKTITPSDYADYGFKMTIDVGAGGQFSEVGQFTFIQGMYDKQDITKYQYVKYAPTNLVPQEMRSDFEEEEQKMLEAEEMAKQQGMEVDGIMSQLSPEEQQILQQQPELLDGL